MQAEFQQCSQKAITQLAGKHYGNTAFENEKRSYPRAMIDILAGNREKAIAFLQSEDADAQRNAHTLGTDNLRAMREVAVYLFAEETGNEETRKIYKERIRRNVRTL